MSESNYEKLFGTPERAARTLSTIAICMGTQIACCDCEYKGLCDTQCNHYALLEWLRGDA